MQESVTTYVDGPPTAVLEQIRDIARLPEWNSAITEKCVVGANARIRTTPVRPVGTWKSWAIALPGADWEEHDEQAIWVEVDD
jgi:hypothetical protein